jgi:NAD-dependent DNA ligase
LFSRGNGKIGSLLSEIVPYITFDSFNYKLSSGFIRGELIMKKDIFLSKYSKKFKNARNLVAGQISKKKIDENILKDIYFIPYELINSDFLNFRPGIQLSKIYKKNNKNFKWIEISICELSFDFLLNVLKKWNEEIPFEIDGIVVQSNIEYKSISKGNPKNSFAFKNNFFSEEIIVKVIDVSWELSKWGAFKPVVHIEPTQISGVVVRRITGHNAKNIKNKAIGKDALVKIVRSGNVIPHIIKTIKPAVFLNFPDGIWKGVDIYKKNFEQYNPEIEIKWLTSLFKKLDVKYLGSKTVEKMFYECNLKTFFEMINCDLVNLILSFQKLSSERILNSLIELKSRPIFASVLISGFGIFGKNIGEKRVSNLLKIVGHKNVPSIDTIQNIDGFANTIATQIFENFDRMLDLIDECKENGLNVIWDDDCNNNENKSKKKICISGFRDKKFEEIFIVLPQISKNIDFLVVLDKNSTTSKVKKAKMLNIKIITYEECCIENKIQNN